MKLLLEAPGVEVNSKNFEGCTPLSRAASVSYLYTSLFLQFEYLYIEKYSKESIPILLIFLGDLGAISRP